MKILKKVYDLLHFCISTIDKIALMIMLLAICADVVFRQFGSGIVWAQEVATIFFVWFTFFSMVEGVKHKLHIRITFLSDRLPQAIQTALNYFSEIAVGITGVLMCYYGAKLVHTATRSLAATGWSARWLYIVIPIAGFVVCLDSIVFIVKRVMGMSVEDELDSDSKIVQQAKEVM
ncbi:MAG: TRAP transporter small permease [Mobilitalea sp.]